MELTTNRQRTAGERKSKLLFGVKQPCIMNEYIYCSSHLSDNPGIIDCM